MRVATVLLCGGLVLSGVARAQEADFDKEAPAPGRETARPMVPDWCPAGWNNENKNDHGRAERSTQSLATDIGRDIGSQPIRILNSLDDIARQGCDYPDDKFVQQQVAYWRQKVINTLGVDDAFVRAQLKIFVRGKEAKAERRAWCDQESKNEYRSNLGERALANRAVDLVCSKDGIASRSLQPDWSLSYWLDSKAYQPSELARLAHVYQCIPEVWTGTSSERMSKNMAVEGYVLCGLDARRLDLKKLDEELAARKLPPVVSATYRQVFAYARRKAEVAREVIGADLKNDPENQKRVLEWGEKAEAEWNQLYDANKAAFDAAFAAEAKLAKTPEGAAWNGQAKDLGCGPVRDAWRAHVQAKKPKTPDEVIAASIDAVGYPLLVRLAACDGAEGRTVDAGAWRSMLAQSKRRWAGPRLYAANTLFDATRAQGWHGWSMGTDVFHSLYAKDEPIGVIAERACDNLGGGMGSIADVNGEQRGSELANRSRSGDMWKGKVGTMKKGADGVAVVFKKDVWEEPDFSCQKAGISMYESDGKPVYLQRCKYAGSHKEIFQADPVTLVGFTAAAPKPNQLLKYLQLSLKGKNGYGFAVVVAEAVKGKPPKVVNYFGFDLR